MKPPPPILPAAGYVTASASAVATAAPPAVPPCFRIDTPTSEPGPDTDTTRPWRASSAVVSAGMAAFPNRHPTTIARAARTVHIRYMIGPFPRCLLRCHSGDEPVS